MLLLYVVQYYNHPPEQSRLVYWFAISFFALFISILICGWPISRKARQNKFAITKKGFQSGKELTPWEKIQGIDAGPILFRRQIVRLMLKRQKPRFLATSNPPKAIPIDASPYIYRNVVPAILTMNPDMPVSKRAKKFLAKPDKAGAPIKWLVVVCLISTCAILLCALHSDFQTMLRYQFLGILLMISAGISSFAIPHICNPKNMLVDCTSTCSIITLFVMISFAFSDADFAGIELIFRTHFILTFCAFIAFVVLKRMSTIFQFGVVGLLLIPLVLYFHETSKMLPITDISTARAENDYSTDHIWSRTGNYITDGDGCYIRRIADGKVLHPTKYPQPCDVVWVDDKCLVRKVGDINDTTRLMVYDIEEETESQVPTGPHPIAMSICPVSQDGKTLVWLDQQQDQNLREVRFFNLRTHELSKDAYAIPTIPEWEPRGVYWIDETNIVINGGPPRNQKEKTAYNLHLLCVNTNTQKSVDYISPIKCTGWIPTPNWRYVCGIIHTFKPEKMHLVDMIEQQVIDFPYSFADDEFPLLTSDCAYYVGLHQGQRYLLSLEYATGNEQAVAPVPKGMALYDINNKSGFALLGLSNEKQDKIPFARHQVLDIETGCIRKIRMPNALCIGILPVYKPIPRNAKSPFSPDGRKLIIETLSAEGIHLYLCELPNRSLETQSPVQEIITKP